MTMLALKSLEPLMLLAARSRWRPPEIAFWSFVVASYFLFPGYLVLISQILVAGLFALSLDLMLGYGGMPSLGHAAFFGLGAYAAGLLGQMGWGEPISGLLLSGAIAGVFGLLCSLFLSRLRTPAFLTACASSSSSFCWFAGWCIPRSVWRSRRCARTNAEPRRSAYRHAWW